LKQFVTRRKVAGSFPSVRTTALGSTEALTEIKKRNISWEFKAAGV
jgi:alkylhydroperoxidase family enzyme